MHIFLSGHQRAGKSTLIQKVLKEFMIKPSGFVSVSGPTTNGMAEIYMQDAPGEKITYLNDSNLIGRRYVEGMWQSFPETFDTLGVALLEQAGPPLILMDELGFMENEAHVFQQKVLEILDGNIPVLGVIKPQSFPFLDKVRNHPKVKVLDITTENREEKFCELLSVIKNNLK